MQALLVTYKISHKSPKSTVLLSISSQLVPRISSKVAVPVIQLERDGEMIYINRTRLVSASAEVS